MFAKTSPSRNINDLILQTELKHPLFDSEQHFLESRSLLRFLFHLKEPRIGITSGPVHGSQSWKVPLLMSPLTLGFFCLDLTLPPEIVSPGQSGGFTHTASH